MATQAALISDTIVGMKKALSKENDCSGPDDPISQPSNRGNKLRENANNVREGALGYVNYEQSYKQKIDHAGYTRYILQRNPPRYDSEGDELDEDDEDSEADAAAAEENPFSEIALEQLLCPLKHPSELPVHPSMSHPYTNKALLEMTRAVESKLHQERALLWQARNLHRRFLGDSCWMPCAMVETPEDRWYFAPGINTERSSPTNRDGLSGIGTPLANSASQTQKDGTRGLHSEAVSPKQTESHGATNEVNNEAQFSGTDVEMPDANAINEKDAESSQIKDSTNNLKSEDFDATVGDLPQHRETNDLGPGTRANGNTFEYTSTEKPRSVEQANGKSPAKFATEQSTTDAPAEPKANEKAQEEEPDRDVEMEGAASPEPLSRMRMTTRAQTNATNPHPDPAIASPPSSSQSIDPINALPTPHPLFLVPDSIRPDPTFGLPPNEAEDTKRLLWSYIQKQEETVRGFEHMLECLLRACRMKEDVWEWCKAEGHLGEMSDGEDWYDPETWGLAPGEELKKGADEDEAEAVDEGRTAGKRGRRRQ